MIGNLEDRYRSLMNLNLLATSPGVRAASRRRSGTELVTAVGIDFFVVIVVVDIDIGEVVILVAFVTSKGRVQKSVQGLLLS